MKGAPHVEGSQPELPELLLDELLDVLVDVELLLVVDVLDVLDVLLVLDVELLLDVVVALPPAPPWPAVSTLPPHATSIAAHETRSAADERRAKRREVQMAKCRMSSTYQNRCASTQLH
jgi:hypothetical protein